MLRTSIIIPLATLVLMRQGFCDSCLGIEDEPCQYVETPLTAEAETSWGTTVAEDIAELEMPRHGTWYWGENRDFVTVDQSGVELPAWAAFVHDPDTIRSSEHVGGGRGTACYAPPVLMDGTLTFTDDQGGVIVSVPITVEWQDGDYGSSPQYIPPSLYSSEVHELMEWEFSQVFGAIIWAPNGFFAEFYYWGQSMTTETTGDGVASLVGEFTPDETP